MLLTSEAWHTISFLFVVSSSLSLSRKASEALITKVPFFPVALLRLGNRPSMPLCMGWFSSTAPTHFRRGLAGHNAFSLQLRVPEGLLGPLLHQLNPFLLRCGGVHRPLYVICPGPLSLLHDLADPATPVRDLIYPLPDFLVQSLLCVFRLLELFYFFKHALGHVLEILVDLTGLVPAGAYFDNDGGCVVLRYAVLVIRGVQCSISRLLVWPRRGPLCYLSLFEGAGLEC